MHCTSITISYLLISLVLRFISGRRGGSVDSVSDLLSEG